MEVCMEKRIWQTVWVFYYLSILLTWNAIRTDLAEVLAEVSTCITASIGVGVLWKSMGVGCKGDFSIP